MNLKKYFILFLPLQHDSVIQYKIVSVTQIIYLFLININKWFISILIL